jgi:hypothetical protein
VEEHAPDRRKRLLHQVKQRRRGSGPEAAVVEGLEKEALGLAIGDHVLVEAQLPAGTATR